VNYNALPQTPCTAMVSGAGGLSQTVSVSYSNNTNAGTASASASYPGDANHTGSSDSKNFTINKAVLTVKADNKSMILHATLPMFTASYSGFKGSDTFASSVTGAPSLSSTATSASPVGTYTIVTANGTLAANNYSFAFANGTLTIAYSIGACLGDLGHTILQPINPDGSSVFNSKSTSPAKFRVCDASGASIGTAGVVQNFLLYQTINGTTTSTVNEPVDSTTPDANFRWDPSAQQWIFNINNKALTANKTYVFVITLNDQSTIPFQYGLR
jgi:MBG domain (YGX type)